jgi:hypothetical protein
MTLVASCQTTFAQSNAVQAGGSASAATNIDVFHGRYATYGVEATNSIRVLVVGQACIKNPGYYFLPRNANFADAIKTAGVKERYKDYYYPGLVISIGRKGQTKGRYRMLHFETRQEAEKEMLQDGDEIQMDRLE